MDGYSYSGLWNFTAEPSSSAMSSGCVESRKSKQVLMKILHRNYPVIDCSGRNSIVVDPLFEVNADTDEATGAPPMLERFWATAYVSEGLHSISEARSVAWPAWKAIPLLRRLFCASCT